MQSLDTIHDYLRSHSEEIGARILSSYPALHGADETPSPLLSGMVRLRRGIDVAICHPKIVETGLDLLDFPTILFHETGYSLHTLRQSSRRSWRIGQRRPVEVKFFAYAGNHAGSLSSADG